MASRRRAGRRFSLSPLAAIVVASLFAASGILVLAPNPPSARGPTVAEDTSAAPSVIPGRTIALNESAAPVGAEPLVNLTNFVPDGEATVGVYNASVPSFIIWSNPFFYLNSSGDASQPFFPGVTGSVGAYEFSGNESGAPNVSAPFAIDASALSVGALPSSAASGSSILVTADGFTADATVTIYLGSASSYVSLLSTLTNGSGDISTSVTLPGWSPGSYVLFVADGAGEYAATAVSIVGSSAGISLSMASGPVDAEVVATLSGFTPPVTVTFGGRHVCPTLGGVAPNLHCTFAVPPSVTGVYAVDASDSSSDFASTPFTVTGLYPAYFLVFNSITSGPYRVNSHAAFLLNQFSINPIPGTPTSGLNASMNFTQAEFPVLALGVPPTQENSVLLYGVVVNSTGVFHLFLSLAFTQAVVFANLTGAGGQAPVLWLHLLFTYFSYQAVKYSIPGPLPSVFPAYMLTGNQKSGGTSSFPQCGVRAGSGTGLRIGTLVSSWSLTSDWLNLSMACNGRDQGWLVFGMNAEILPHLLLEEFNSSGVVQLIIQVSQAEVSGIVESASYGTFPTFALEVHFQGYRIST